MSAHRFALTIKSRNAKTGPIPVSTTSRESCPASCPLRANGCYADGGPLGMFWDKVTDGRAGGTLGEFVGAIAALPAGQLWRHNQAGDLPADASGAIDTAALGAIVSANAGRRGFTYTHHDVTRPENAAAVRDANRAGFTINLSGNSLAHADALAALEVGPVVAIVEPGGPQSGLTPAGRKYTVCPAQRRDDVSCATCQLCARQRDVVVAFEAHGVRTKRVIQITRAAA